LTPIFKIGRCINVENYCGLAKLICNSEAF
jgi:hypothetical protein